MFKQCEIALYFYGFCVYLKHVYLVAVVKCTDFSFLKLYVSNVRPEINTFCTENAEKQVRLYFWKFYSEQKLLLGTGKDQKWTKNCFSWGIRNDKWKINVSSDIFVWR